MLVYILSPAIIIDTKDFIPFHDPFGIRNNLKSERRNSNIYPKLPYDNAAMPVKQIDAFRPQFTGRLIYDLRIAASSQVQKNVFECRLDGRFIRADFAGLKLIGYALLGTIEHSGRSLACRSSSL